MKVTIKSTIKVVNNNDKVQGVVYDAVKDYTADLRAVSISRTPYRKGNLESSSTSKVTNGTKVVGEVGFLAKNKDYNYAVKMHDSNYNLGAESRRKKAKRSKYSQKAFKVGKGYLVETANACRKGYEDDLAERLDKLLK